MCGHAGGNLPVRHQWTCGGTSESDSIWKEAKLEGLAVTYPDTQAIFDGLAPNGLRLSEIITVNNLKYGWRFLLDNLDVPIDLPYVCQINKLLGGDNLILRAGLLRTTSVSIGGTTWKPEIPNPDQVRTDLENIQKLPTATEQAITLMLYLMRSQLILDGNKRTAQLCANQIMISAGCGIITIPIEQQSHFLSMLIDFYETNNQDKIAQFVYDYCIDGI